eukprot:TRINITY_DN2942_c0_g1_i1.p1 TRINITY_DN2942_c0_g1~~TRINITY_DN2942_c0_g1_i1.p1  ORF type:complete len:181 (+),score=35.83 TRINITY_DN2942_c0_g1_i1:161-703(+)
MDSTIPIPHKLPLHSLPGDPSEPLGAKMSSEQLLSQSSVTFVDAVLRNDMSRLVDLTTCTQLELKNQAAIIKEKDAIIADETQRRKRCEAEIKRLRAHLAAAKKNSDYSIAPLRDQAADVATKELVESFRQRDAKRSPPVYHPPPSLLLTISDALKGGSNNVIIVLLAILVLFFMIMLKM